MTSLNDFITLLHSELGLDIQVSDVNTSFDHLHDWDSVYMLRLVTALEATTGRRIEIPALLQSRSLGDVYRLVEVRV